MEEYVSNSHKSKEEAAKKAEKKIEPVVTGAVKQRKKSEIRKLTDVFVSEDVGNVKSYILMDVLVPAIKKAVSDIVTNGVDMLLYGESGRTKKRDAGASRVSYRSYYEKERERREGIGSRVQTGYDFDEYVLNNRGEAEEVLSQMDDLIDRYKVVTVADYCELIGVRSRYTDNNYGWTSIRNARVVPVRDGYVIKLPKVMPLD